MVKTALGLAACFGVAAEARAQEAFQVRGSVFDSTTMTPLAYARVAVIGTNVIVDAAEDGSFLLTDVPEGSHWVSFFHERLAELGVSPPAKRITLADQGTDDILLAVPAETTLLAAWCLAEQPALGAASLAGVVTDSLTGVPLPGAVIAAEPPQRGALGPKTVEVRADDGGRYRMCDVPPLESMRLHASFGPSRGRTVELDLRAGGPRVVDLTMLLAAEATLRGRVFDPTSAESVPEASVSVLGTDAHVLTDADGLFLIDDLPPGRHLVVTDHLAYEQRTDSVTLFGQETVDIEVRMAQEAIELEGFVVTARSRFGRSSLAGDDKRADYITRERIEELLPRTTTAADLLRNLNAPGLRIRDVWTEGPAGVRMQGYCIEVSRRSGGQGCRPAAVFFNDTPVTYPDEFIRGLDPQIIQRIEVLGPVDAQFQFGTIAGSNGAILIYSTEG